MSQCYIYNKSFFSNINYSNELTINLDKLKELIPAKDATNDGVWQPIIIGPDQSDTKWTEILSSPNTDIDTSFNPCNCNPTTSEDYESLVTSNVLHCDYCLDARGTGNIPFSGTITNSRTNAVAPYRVIDFCSGVLDSRTLIDDILPKIPKLNQKYITKFNDFKYLNLFPANSNAGLGFEQFVQASTLKSFSTSPKLMIDWKIKETIGEIPYNPDTSQYDSIEDHTKAYNKFLQTGKTCGNFYLTKLNPEAEQVLSPDKQKLKDAIAKFKKDNPAYINSDDQAIIAIIITDGPSTTYLGMTPEEAENFINNMPLDALLFENLIGDLKYNLENVTEIPDRESWLGGLQEIIYLESEEDSYVGFKTTENVRRSVSYGRSVIINPPPGIVKSTLRYAEFYWTVGDILFQNENNEDIQPGDPEWEDIRNFYTKLAVIYNSDPKNLGQFPIPVTDEILQRSLNSGELSRKQLLLFILANNYISQVSTIKNNDIPFPTTAAEADVNNTNLFEKIEEYDKSYYTPLSPGGAIGEWRAFDCLKYARPLLPEVVDDQAFHINIAIDAIPMNIFNKEGKEIPTINISSISNIIMKCKLGMNLTYTTNIPDPVFPDAPIIPYGFKNNTYDNIYIKDIKLGSHWKWNPTSGVLCWYRYTNSGVDPDMNNSNRVISGVDLYISPGDIFHATNIGPEILNKNPIGPDNYDCPSGLKLVKNNEIAGIIPEKSQFTYISNNIYPRVLELYESISLADILDNTQTLPIDKFNLACTLATGPQYDNIIVDLFKRGSYKSDDDYNSFKQLTLLNKFSTIGTLFQNANGFNGYVKTKEDLINTLAHKYGCYLWQEPNSSGNLTTKNNINAQSAVNLTFDAVIEKDTNISTASCSTFTSCTDSANLKKKFSYDQLFSCGGATLNSSTNVLGRYDQRCNANVGMETYKAAMTSSLLFNGNKLKETVYSSGCYVFQDIYPKAHNPNRSAKKQTCGTFSNPCGPESSYGIYSENSNSLCINGTTTNNVTTYWCDYPTANSINNSNKLNNGVTNRPSGTYYNDTLYFKRAYPFAAFMPHIDTVAFHKQRGVYFQSKDFGNDTVFVQDGNQYVLASSPMTIGFTTKDVGIKIYSASIEKLREPSDTNTYNCRAFPSKDSCKCFPITFLPEYPYSCESKSSITYTNNPILYTPNLSCQYSIKSYGGYDRIYLDSIVAAGSTIPNHPNIGALLPKVDTKINPEIPYGCEKSQTMTINNYTKSTWSFNLNNFSTVHADIWAEVIEAVNLFKTTIDFVNADNEDDQKTNPEYKRFATKVEINNVSLYNKQKKVIGNSRSINMTLTNPFLKALLKGEDHILYPREINSLGYCIGAASYNGDFTIGGDQISPVSIKFSSIPRKQILNFAIQKPDDTGKLKRGFFNPNSGIVYDNKDSSPIIVYNSGEGYYLNYDKELFNGSYNDGIVLIGDLNIKIKQILDTIGSFDNHKKARLYLKVNDKWLEYNIHNTFGFVQDQIYIGEPYVFEHTLNDKTKFTNGPIVPVAAKQNLLFDIKYNPVGTGAINVLSSYPLMDNEKVLGGSYNLVYSNIRPYFYVGEKITENSDYLQTNFTNLLIDFNINNIGYVSGSLRPTEQTVTYYEASDTSFRNPQTFKILSKKLNIISDSAGYGIQTIFEIDQKPKLNNSNTLIIDFSSTGNNTNPYGIDSVVLYQNIESLKFERDSRLANRDYKTKWGDVINYDGKPHHELSNYIFNQNYLNKYYPESLYDSFADTIAINNNTSGLYNYIIKNNKTDTNTSISYSGLSYVLQHQRYNIGQLEIANNFDDYKNYLPFIDLNFVPNPGEVSSIRDKMPASLYNLNTSHSLYISGVYCNTPKTKLVNYSDTDKKFWINLQPANLMKSAITINKEFYSNTLRIDDVPFKLRNIKTSSSISSSSKCRAIFRPSINISNVSFPDNFFNFSDYSNRVFKTDPFARFPIYCDADDPGQCDGDPARSCSIKTIGTVNVSGEYDILTESTGTITSKIGEKEEIPYILSYDGGLYNVVGNNKLHYIQRFELNPINNLYPLGGCSSESSPRPASGKFSILNEEYQKILSESVATHTDLVKDTDSLANEMLFRILYGSKQKLNLTSIDSSNDDLISYEDLIKYSDPKTEAKDIYKNIPYDLDVNSKSKNRQITGNISIDGVLKVGKSVSISIGDSSIGISIKRNNGKIEAVASLPNGKTKKTILYTEYTDDKRLSVTNGPISSVQPAGTTVRRLSICEQSPSLYVINNNSSCENIPNCEVVSKTTSITVADRGISRGVGGDINWGCAKDLSRIRLPDGTEKPAAPCSSIAYGLNQLFPLPSRVFNSIISDINFFYAAEAFDTNPCGTCFTTDKTYWFGKYHNRYYGLGSPGSSNAQTACECEPYEYGYCRETTDCGCPYEYSEFTYSFEHCRHNFTLKGYKRKFNGKLSDPNLIRQPLPNSWPSEDGKRAQQTCSSFYNSNELCNFGDYSDGYSYTFDETCSWIIVKTPSPTYVYLTTTRTNNDRYSPICSTNLCNILYTNNKLTLIMGKVNECIDINLRDDCPPISITVPDNTFIIRDDIDSSCVDCDIEPHSIKMNDQNPPWEIITETRTCVLGHFLDGGDLNTEFVTLLGANWVGQCFGSSSSTQQISSGYGQCGKVAPESFPWYTYISDGLTMTCGGHVNASFAGHGLRVTYGLNNPYTGSSVDNQNNPIVRQKLKTYWEERMKNLYENVAPCKTNFNLYTEDDTNVVYDFPNRIDTSNTYNINDIVEGIVPGTCQFNFTTVSYPGVAISAGIGNPRQSAVTVTVKVAYYTYSYRRPKNIQDILIGEEITKKCNTLSTLDVGTSTPYLSSKYKTRDCADSPSCYNNRARNCNNDDGCCIMDQ